MRRNLQFIDFVDDPAVADIHIIINNRTSGSGGQVYSIRYNNKTFENFSEFALTCTTAASDTYEERREKILRGNHLPEDERKFMGTIA